jgi:hypothetical protein
MYFRYIRLWVVAFNVLPSIALFTEYSAAIVVGKATDALDDTIVFFGSGVKRRRDAV